MIAQNAPAALEKPLLVSTSAMASPSHALCKPMLKATRTPCCHPLSALNATPMEIPSPLCMHRQTSKSQADEQVQQALHLLGFTQLLSLPWSLAKIVLCVSHARSVERLDDLPGCVVVVVVAVVAVAREETLHGTHGGDSQERTYEQCHLVTSRVSEIWQSRPKRVSVRPILEQVERGGKHHAARHGESWSFPRGVHLCDVQRQNA
mmetsp:Transcript_3009/g.8207  ORF Transcript_3009/g.8207 Transcript_3009/m.8207 type:complete len:206 (+) Transcript_3009:326-943(+)